MALPAVIMRDHSMAAAGIASDRPRTGSWQLQVRQLQAWSSRKGSRLGYSPQGTLGYTVWTLLTVEEVGAGILAALVGAYQCWYWISLVSHPASSSWD